MQLIEEAVGLLYYYYMNIIHNLYPLHPTVMDWLLLQLWH